MRNLEVKLILHELKDAHLVQELAAFIHKHVHSFIFGPFHASILIGDVLLEWLGWHLQQQTPPKL